MVKQGQPYKQLLVREVQDLEEVNQGDQEDQADLGVLEDEERSQGGDPPLPDLNMIITMMKITVMKTILDHNNIQILTR